MSDGPRAGRNGIPPAPPSSPLHKPAPAAPATAWEKDSDSGEPPERERSDFDHVGRVTIDFSGPPLDLPENDSDADEEGDGRVEKSAELAIDTSEFHRSEELEESERGATVSSEESELDLDFSELEDGPKEGAPESHDAWALDRRRRSTPLSVPQVRGREDAPPPSEPPPIDPSHLVSKPTKDLPLEEGGRASASASAGDALTLVDRSRPSTPDLDLVSDMAERYALGDFTGALRAAELLIGMEPDNEEAQRYARSSRERLEQLYTSRLGSLRQVPVVVVPDHEVRWLGLDHRAGFLLSRIDGRHDVEEVLDVSGMPRLEALKTLVELLEVHAIRLEG